MKKMIHRLREFYSFQTSARFIIFTVVSLVFKKR